MVCQPHRRPVSSWRFGISCSLLLATSACTTPLFYAVSSTEERTDGAWTQAPGASAAAGWSPEAAAWPEGPGGGTPDLYQAKSLDDLAWGSELQAESAEGTLRDGKPTLPRRDEYAEDSFGALPNAPLGSNAARTVSPGSTGTGSFGAKDPLGLGPNDAPTAQRTGTDGGALVAGSPGSTGELDLPTREIQSDGSGRPFLFELFQEARDERDALRIENDELLSSAARFQEELSALRETAVSATSELERTQADRDALRDQIETLQTEKDELEARLLTAQIRRLEAEKGLIEHWIQGELDAASAGLSEAASALIPEATEQTSAP